MGFNDKDEMMYRNNMIPGKVHLCHSFEKKYENKVQFIVHQYWKYLIGHDDTTEEEDEEEEYEDAKKCSSTAGYISRERVCREVGR